LSVLTPVYNERYVVEASLLRVLAIDHPLIGSLELVIVDDCSTDGTLEILQALAARDSRVVLVRHDRNLGKGAAVRTAIDAATGDVCIIQDADFEYNPSDIPALLLPFAEEGADAVFGSRYLPATYRRTLTHTSCLKNKPLTAVSNWFADLDLTDMETCYKAVNTALLKSIPLRSNDFRFEVEITFKLAKRHARIFEVPIRYLPRTREEGKKFWAWDAVLALGAILHFAFVDDLYKPDQYGSGLLSDLRKARRFTSWVANKLRPHLGDRVLEINAGLASLTHHFIPRDVYVAAETNPHFLRYLRDYALGKPYLTVMDLDPSRPEDFVEIEGQFDTVLMLNVIERLPEPGAALRIAGGCLKPGGRLLVQVPQHKNLFGSLDQERRRRSRFERRELESLLRGAGFQIETVFDFNRLVVPGWWLTSKILRRKRFSRLELILLDAVFPLFRSFDILCPWPGLSLIAVAVKL
jgi:glycosyltransferase involved in cell wall biosynthesis